MSVISAQTIRHRCIAENLIESAQERTVAYGLSFGIGSCGYDVRIAESMILYPHGWWVRRHADGQMEVSNYQPDFRELAAPNREFRWSRATSFSLASTLERMNTPTDLCGYVRDKSTWVRRGLTVKNTVIEPGWSGFLTLELTNDSQEPIKLERGMPIAQIQWDTLDEVTQQPYAGKYQNQPAGAQQPLYEGQLGPPAEWPTRRLQDAIPLGANRFSMESIASGLHRSHRIRSSDASTFDFVCELCGNHDQVPGGWGRLAEPCPVSDIKREEYDAKHGTPK